MQKIKIGLFSLGCKVNYAEGSTITRQLKELNCEIVDFTDFADIYIINTCTVTQIADKKSRAIIRQAYRRNPNAIIAVIGCLSQLQPDEIAEIEGVKVVLGSSNKFTIVDIIKKYQQQNQLPATKNNTELNNFIDAYSSTARTRAFLKIQDGCDYFCHYCTVPYARGRSRSDSIINVITNIKKIEDLGIKEIVLTGVNIGDFGKHNNENLAILFNKIIQQTTIPRIRISSIEPDLLSNEIIDIIASEKRFMPHFHIPLQAANDYVLQLMGRRYNLALVEEKINSIHAKIANVCIAIDIICGFPGETITLFNEAINFIKQLNIAYLHVFTYSERKNTKAINFVNQIPINERRERSSKMQEISDEKKKLFLQRNVGSINEVLWESENSNGFMYGFTRNYIKCATPFNSQKINTIETVKLGKISKGNIIEITETLNQ